jgi:hypothetical protein
MAALGNSRKVMQVQYQVLNKNQYGCVLATLGMLITLMGVRIRNNGMRTIVPSEVDNAWRPLRTDTKWPTASTAAARVVINMHGSGLEAGFERVTYEIICATLDCRGIAISLPGCGFTDEKPGHQVKDWPADDDSAIPSAQGKWFAEHFGADYRHASEGYGHMTYCTGQYQNPDKSLIAALLRCANQIE